MLAGLLAILLAFCLAGRGWAEEELVPHREPTGLTEPSGQLVTPTSGAIFVIEPGVLRPPSLG